jgi:hypothetical protein
MEFPGDSVEGARAPLPLLAGRTHILIECSCRYSALRIVKIVKIVEVVLFKLHSLRDLVSLACRTAALPKLFQITGLA